MSMRSLLVLGATIIAAPTALATPYASQVVTYTPGSVANLAYTVPARALGEPSRTIQPDGTAVTPFAAPYSGSQLVSVGVGGELILRFDQPVTNDPFNPFGIDLLVFGNSFFYDPATFGPTANAIFGSRGRLEVSPNGVDWTAVPSFRPDGAMPTLGYVDVTDPYASAPGAILTDFTRPVDPALNWTGMDLAQLTAAYNGSGGGAGVDIGALGLSAISFVRVTVPAGESGTVNIDAFSDVAPIPAPGAIGTVALAALITTRRRR